MNIIRQKIHFLSIKHFKSVNTPYKSVLKCFIILLCVLPMEVVCMVEDTTIAKNFIIKSRILLLNQKPRKEDALKEVTSFKLLSGSEDSKITYVHSIISRPEFARSIFNLFVNEFLQGLDDELIYKDMRDFKFAHSIEVNPESYAILSQTLQNLNKLQQCYAELYADVIDITEVQKRIVNNKFYDEKNMGSDNIVNSTFMYLFSRNPTKSELSAGVNMIENTTSTLFNQTGNSKEDYYNIIFNCAEYREGQVKYWYQKLLNRQPSTNEVIATIYTSDFDIKKLIVQIVSSKEFAKF